MKRIALLAAFGLIATTGNAPAPTSALIASGTNNLMYQVFQDWCLRAAPNFDAINTRATDGKLRLLGDNKTAQPGGSQVETKQWQFAKDSGSYAIGAANTVRDGKTMAACTVYFASLSDASMPQFLSEPGRLGPPKQPSSKESVLWNGPFANTAIRLDLRNSGQVYQGVLTLMQTEPNQ